MIDDTQLFNDKPKEWEDFCNYQRLHASLSGRTPRRAIPATGGSRSDRSVSQVHTTLTLPRLRRYRTSRTLTSLACTAIPDRSRFRRPFIPEPAHRVNERIHAREVRLIGADGKQVGVVPLQEALRQARVAGLELVEVNAGVAPPVCRLLDYGKYQYAQDKREREGKKKQKKVELKAVRISFKMGEHDRELRRLLAEKFLKDGNRVRVDMVLRGREKALVGHGREIMQSFINALEPLAQVEEPITRSPRGLTGIITAKGGA